MSRYGSRKGFLSHEARKITVVWCLRQGATAIRNKRRAARNTKTRRRRTRTVPLHFPVSVPGV